MGLVTVGSDWIIGNVPGPVSFFGIVPKWDVVFPYVTYRGSTKA